MPGVFGCEAYSAEKLGQPSRATRSANRATVDTQADDLEPARGEVESWLSAHILGEEWYAEVTHFSADKVCTAVSVLFRGPDGIIQIGSRLDILGGRKHSAPFSDVLLHSSPYLENFQWQGTHS